MGTYRELLDKMHAANNPFLIGGNMASGYTVTNAQGHVFARCDHEADAARIVKALNAPNLSPAVTCLGDFLAMAENENVQLGPSANGYTQGQWASVKRDARTILDSLKVMGF